MGTAEIVRRIDEVIDDALMPRGDKIELLKELARAYWRVVFPELETSEYERLSAGEKQARWTAVRMRNELEGTKNIKKIIYMIDWPGRGGPFKWVE
jgi:hypothetical protein